MRFLTTVAMALVLTAGAAEAKTIGVAMTKTEDKFLGTLLKGIEEAAAKAKGVTLRVEDARGDPAKQIEQIKAMAADKVDALIVVLSDGDLGIPVSKIGADADIPLVYVNNVPVNSDELPPKQTVVASDELESGTMETQEVCRLLGGKGKAVVLVGEYFSPSARIRTQDIDDVLATKACKGISTVERQSANWSRDQADSLMREWLGAGVKFDAVIANNDEMALGAIRVMKEKGIPMDKVVVGGVDATDDALAAMVAGDLDVTVLQNAPQQGAKSVEAAVKLISGETVPPMIKIPFELVTPANVQSYLPKSQ